jgi:hypothetical protein
MTGPEAPAEVAAAAEARATARARRDWAEADRLKGDIEAAGWRVVDAGLRYSLRPAVPPDVFVDGRVLYGSSASVPSRLDAEPVGLASVVVVARDDPVAVERSLSALREHAPDGTQLVVVANGPSRAQAEVLEELDALDPGAPGIGTEVVWTAERLGYAAAWNAGIRRAEAPIVVLLDAELAAPTGDVVSPLVELLGDETVAVAGPWGLRFGESSDFRRLEPASGDVVAVDRALMAFRRSEYVARGPLDEGFRDAAWLDVWWSLVLREPAGATPGRRAVAPSGLAAERLQDAVAGDPRQAKRNYYRLLEGFRGREVEFGEIRP